MEGSPFGPWLGSDRVTESRSTLPGYLVGFAELYRLFMRVGWTPDQVDRLTAWQIAALLEIDLRRQAPDPEMLKERWAKYEKYLEDQGMVEFMES